MTTDRRRAQHNERKQMTEPTPHRYRAVLIPEWADPPEPAAEASERLRVAGLAAEEARRTRREADRAAKQAPRLDSQAAIEAVRNGDDPPPATAPKLKAEAQLAREREGAARKIADGLAKDLERAVREQAGAWVPGARESAEAAKSAALAAIDDLAAALDALGQHAGLVAHLQENPGGRVIEHARRFKARAVGFDAHDGSKFPAAKALVKVREQIEDAMPDPLPTPEQAEAEQRNREQHRKRERVLAKAGASVVIPG